MNEVKTVRNPVDEPLHGLSPDHDPWVADLNGSFTPTECQSTVAFDNHLCNATPYYYVELQLQQHPVANPRWEGKLCTACLAGWLEWSAEDTEGVRIVSVNPIVTGQ